MVEHLTRPTFVMDYPEDTSPLVRGHRTQPGVVKLFDTHTRALASGVNSITVGALPDMLTFTPDGKQVLVANEGEPNSYGLPDSVDPEGGVAVITLDLNPLAAAVARCLAPRSGTRGWTPGAPARSAVASPDASRKTRPVDVNRRWPKRRSACRTRRLAVPLRSSLETPIALRISFTDTSAKAPSTRRDGPPPSTRWSTP